MGVEINLYSAAVCPQGMRYQTDELEPSKGRSCEYCLGNSNSKGWQDTECVEIVADEADEEENQGTDQGQNSDSAGVTDDGDSSEQES